MQGLSSVPAIQILHFTMGRLELHAFSLLYPIRTKLGVSVNTMNPDWNLGCSIHILLVGWNSDWIEPGLKHRVNGALENKAGGE